MAKRVYRQTEILPSNIKISIDVPEFKMEKKLEIPELIEAEEMEVKTLEEEKKEREEFEKEFEDYKKTRNEEAEKEVNVIIEKAKKDAFEMIQKANADSLRIKQEAKDEASDIKKKAELEAREIESEFKDKEAKLLSDARKKGYQEGWEEGINKGTDEVKRLIERIQIILNTAIQKRTEIFIESEQQIINLVLLIAKKVIKVISENQKNVVINNVIQSLRKLKSRGEVAIRVNLADLDLTTQHKKDFIEMVEGVKSIKILEDSTVDRGGCIIDTDFGSIDARISSQLHEIEDKILELMPIMSKGTPGAVPI